MAKGPGREFNMKKGATKIASVRVTSATWAGTPIDVTTDDDQGIMAYLDDTFATETLELSVEGLTDDDVFSNIAFAVTPEAKHLSDLTLVRPNGDVIGGKFILTSYAETGNYQEAVTFTAALVRNGIHTLTPA